MHVHVLCAYVASYVATNFLSDSDRISMKLSLIDADFSNLKPITFWLGSVGCFSN